jgi:hypothetical protein
MSFVTAGPSVAAGSMPDARDQSADRRAIGKTVTLIADPAGDRPTHAEAITKLSGEMAAGKVGRCCPG